MANINSVIKNLMATSKNVGAAAVLSMDGRVLYSTDNWSISGPDIISQWTNRQASIIVQGIKYSTLQSTEERLVATNVQGQGHIVMATARYKGLLLTWIKPDADPGSTYIDVSRAATSIQL